jgi:hypothetical protein
MSGWGRQVPVMRRPGFGGGFGDCAADALSRAVSDRSVLDRYGPSSELIKALGRKADEIISKGLGGKY